MKFSSVYSATLLTVCALALLFHQHHCFEIRSKNKLSRPEEQSSEASPNNKDKIRQTFSHDTKGLDCNKTLSGGNKDSFMSNIQTIFPGTKWCGGGNVSDSFDDLGKFSKTDSCCRDHDLCPESIEADDTKYGLENTGLFTRSHCDCDTRFHECLKKTNTIVGDSIGYTYFTILGPQCFREDYPIVDCVEEEGGRCEKYETDPNGEKLYQWFDNPLF